MVTSNSNRVRVSFVSNDIANSRDGFSLEYRIFGCGEVFTHSPGYFEYSTPEPASAGVDPNVHCRWTIRAPVGQRILLTIREMSIGELSEGQCDFAKLQIFNSPTVDGVPSSSLCGTLADNRNFTSTGNYMTLHLDPMETFPNERSRLKVQFHFIEGGCGGSFSIPSGQISSPVVPGTNFYPPNVYCQWFIHAQPMHAVNLTFTDFKLEDSRRTNCRFDHVTVYDSFDASDSNQLLRHCGTSLPQPKSLISNHGNDMLVELKADGSIQHEGFKATFQEYCGAFVNLTSDNPSVDFSSPNHPRPFPLGANCSWTFQAVGGQRILLDFTRFDLPNATIDGVNCATYLQVFDGQEANAVDIGNGKICGTLLPASIFSRSSMMTVRFWSSLSLIPRNGFLATAAMIDESMNCGRTIEADHGLISSPMYPDAYPPNFECIWILKASPGNKISVRMT